MSAGVGKLPGHNLEQKFRCAELWAVELKAVEAGAEDHGLIFQHDLFFSPPPPPMRTDAGGKHLNEPAVGSSVQEAGARLKLRLFPHNARDDGIKGGGRVAELISYVRADGKSSRLSEYHIAPVSGPEALVAVLTQALGAPRSLRKTRHLFIYGQTRIHADVVHSLGDATFVELETVIGTQTEAEARAELEKVVALLGLSEVVPGAYIDLVEK